MLITDYQYLGDKKNSPQIVIFDNFYTEEELGLIWRELDFLKNPNKLKNVEYIRPAQNDEGVLLKRAKGFFFESIYLDRSFSDILTINRKIFSDYYTKKLVSLNPIFRYFILCNRDTTLLSYYSEGDYYEEHQDMSLITILNYFNEEPKPFEGGNLLFNDFDIEIEVKNNRTVIFPGCYSHEVLPITKVEDNHSGRFCITQFLNHVAPE
jgi:Rps23 Pro-64 3,4-dihydroxylase Tpa1-like proline 4-hydroxylase